MGREDEGHSTLAGNGRGGHGILAGGLGTHTLGRTVGTTEDRGHSAFAGRLGTTQHLTADGTTVAKLPSRERSGTQHSVGTPERSGRQHLAGTVVRIGDAAPGHGILGLVHMIHPPEH